MYLTCLQSIIVTLALGVFGATQVEQDNHKYFASSFQDLEQLAEPPDTIEEDLEQLGEPPNNLAWDLEQMEEPSGRIEEELDKKVSRT